MSQLFAYELNGQRVSRAAFYAVACDPRRSVAVEACAGAGKTWMLVSRMLRALLDGAQPHEILAITFTKKAAGEMRQRLQEWLEQFAQDTPEKLVKELVMRGISPQAAPALVEPLSNLYRTLLKGGRPVQVRTFHSWFAALLRNAPLSVLQQLGLPTSYELLEDDQEAVDAVWRRFHAAVVAQPAARQDYMDAVAEHGRFNTLKGLEAALAKRVEFALADGQGTVDASVKPFGVQYPAFAGLDTPLNMLEGDVTRQRWLGRARALGAEKNKTPQKAAQAVVRAFETADLAERLRLLRGAFFVAEEDRLTHHLQKFEAAQQAEPELQALCAALDQHGAWQHQQRMARLTRLLIAEFSALKRERGWVDMNDVERAALLMLSSDVLSGWVQERLDARVSHLLIDEFQDTNPLQWQALLAWLSGYAGAGGGTGGAAGGAPSVFIVGDPKQSIYRFRRAEPQVFRAAQQFVVEGLGGDLLSCDHTHRNAQRVLAVVNQVMGDAQAAGETSGYRAHTTESAETGAVQRLPQIGRDRAAADAPDPDERAAADAAAPAHRADGDAPLAWRDSLTTPRELAEDSLLALESRQAARWIAAQLVEAGGVRKPGDIMVLARRRAPLSVLQDELRALHIGALQPEKKDLGDAPEVQDVVALLDALVSPSHDLSLARALKSPLFGVPDDALVQLALQKRAAQAQQQAVSWFDLLQKEEQTNEHLRGLGAILTKWQGWVAALPPHDALDAIFADGDLPARFAAAAPAPLRASVLANLGALLGAALQIDGARFLTPYALVRALRAGGARAPALAGDEQVRLLTVHGAKGLQAPVVLMLDTDRPEETDKTMGVLVDWPGEAQAPRRFVFLASEKKPPACSADAVAAERAARQREEINALYVAMTRTCTQLVLSSVQPARAAPGSWWQRLHGLAEPLEAVAEAPRDATQPLQAPTGAPELFYMQKLPPAPVDAGSPATKTIAPEDDDSPEARLGQAMHRLLEWWVPGGAGWSAGQRLSIQREFALQPAQMDEAVAMAQRILGGQGAWAWDTAATDWQGNEVEIHHNGQALRIDRLVRRRDTGEWWVLDHKSARRPELQPGLQQQMAAYRAAVQAAYPQAVVRAAWLTADGQMVEAA
ncbi:MAG: UvrD-helicase domain-containing protein [Ramlibacter sp.]|nr:UvrD-helicase domain-containing protein [Ramlibacter sp.]